MFTVIISCHNFTTLFFGLYNSCEKIRDTKCSGTLLDLRSRWSGASQPQQTVDLYSKSCQTFFWLDFALSSFSFPELWPYKSTSVCPQLCTIIRLLSNIFMQPTSIIFLGETASHWSHVTQHCLNINRLTSDKLLSNDIRGNLIQRELYNLETKNIGRNSIKHYPRVY